MKKYHSLGKLLLDYRNCNQLSQLDFALSLDVDVRTVQRWEKDKTLIKSEKERGIVLETLLPYQLVRNLNATIPIPTYYDFSLRKYSLTKLNNKLPDANWLKSRIKDFTNRIRSISTEQDMDYILKDIQCQKQSPKLVNRNVILEAARRLPELNLIITDDSGYYAGHSIVFPIKHEIFKGLKNRELSIENIQLDDLTDYRRLETPNFYNYDITADCNDNIFYLAHHYLNFFVELQKENYNFCSYTIRHDSVALNKQLGLKLIWEDHEEQKKQGLEVAPRFYVGDFTNYLAN